MKSFKSRIYFHREKDVNRELEEKGMTLNFKNSEDLLYTGYEVGMDVEITETDEGLLQTKVLKIEKVDVSDKEIYI